MLSAGPRWGSHPAVLHLDIDAFFASVEQLRNPTLRDRPVLVGSGVVASASYEARAFGIRAGTPLHEARRLCPAAVIMPGHAATYRAFAERVFSLAAELSPASETFLDDALIDLTGTERLHGHLGRACARLQRRVRDETGLSISMGLASNRMIARMITRLAKPGGFAWLRAGGEFAFVGRRPVEELPGIGPRRAGLLREMGITRISELRELSSTHLRDLFGDLGLVIAARARGHETRALHPAELPRSIRRETSFEEPQVETPALEGMLHYLLERAAAQARRLGAEPKGLRVHLRWADGEGAARQEALFDPATTTGALFERAEAMLQRLRTRRAGVRNLGVELSQLRLRRQGQLDLFAARADDARLPLDDG
ncbi:MAG: DNA polymerase IV, partial [Candidatus Eisenbacteria bacterium]